MTPKEKAEELIEKHKMQCRECGGNETAKIHSLITVNEIINICPFIKIDFATSEGGKESDAKEYWIKVKNEIDNLK